MLFLFLFLPFFFLFFFFLFLFFFIFVFFFSSRRRHTRFDCDWSSDVCSSDLKRTWRRLWRLSALCATPAMGMCVNRSAPQYTFRLRTEAEVRSLSAPPATRWRWRRPYATKSPVRAQIGRASCRERVWIWVGRV